MNTEHINEALEKVGNPNILVNIISRRVRQLSTPGGKMSRQEVDEYLEVIDENLPDGSAVDVGVRVEKRWVLRNVGTSEWDDAVRAVRLSEALWGAPDAVELSEVVAPGAHTTLAVTLEATEPVGVSCKGAVVVAEQGLPAAEEEKGLCRRARVRHAAVERRSCAPALIQIGDRPRQRPIEGPRWNDHRV